MVEDPPYLAEIRKRSEGIDYWGLGLLVVTIGALQTMLDKGQEDDWFSSRFIITCCVVSAIGLVVFICRQLNVEHPILDLRLFAQRNVGTTMFVMFMVGVSLYSSYRADSAVSAGDHGLLRRAGRHGRLFRRHRAHVSVSRGRLPCAQIRSPLAGCHWIHHHHLRPLPHDAT